MYFQKNCIKKENRSGNYLQWVKIFNIKLFINSILLLSLMEKLFRRIFALGVQKYLFGTKMKHYVTIENYWEKIFFVVFLFGFIFSLMGIPAVLRNFIVFSDVYDEKLLRGIWSSSLTFLIFTILFDKLPKNVEKTYSKCISKSTSKSIIDHKTDSFLWCICFSLGNNGVIQKL